jgi:tetratricopeptide (TPR) repeat protein
MASSERLDRALFWASMALVVALLGLGAFFGYTVYRDKVAAEDANPSMRIANAIRQQISKNPNDAVLRVRYGEALAAAGKSQQAIDQFNAALKINPKHTGALIDLGQVALMNKRLSEAAAYFQKVVDLTASGDFSGVNDRRETALYQLGRIETTKKDYAKAIGYFKEALRIRGDASDTYYYLAIALDNSGQVDDAIQQLLTATTFDPSFAQAQYYLGELYVRKGDKASASEHYRKAVAVDPNAPEPEKALAQLGSVSELLARARGLEATDLGAAADTAKIAINVDPESLDAWKLRARLLLKSGDAQGALSAYEEALKIAPGDPEVKAAIAKLRPQPKKQAKTKKK